MRAGAARARQCRLRSTPSRASGPRSSSTAELNWTRAAVLGPGLGGRSGSAHPILTPTRSSSTRSCSTTTRSFARASQHGQTANLPAPELGACASSGRCLAAPGGSTPGEKPGHWAPITLPRVLGRAAPTVADSAAYRPSDSAAFRPCQAWVSRYCPSSRSSRGATARSSPSAAAPRRSRSCRHTHVCIYHARQLHTAPTPRWARCLLAPCHGLRPVPATAR